MPGMDATYERLRTRSAWLDHLHGCPECERHQPCRIGLDKIAAMKAGMTEGESLPEWMNSLPEPFVGSHKLSLV